MSLKLKKQNQGIWRWDQRQKVKTKTYEIGINGKEIKVRFLKTIFNSK